MLLLTNFSIPTRTLCGLCVLQSIWVYTPGIRAGLSVGLPPSPRLGLRPKPHFQKHIGLSTVCNPPIFVGGFLYFLVIVLSDGQRTVFADFEQQYLFFLAGIGIYIYEHLSAVRRGAVKFIAIKLVCACGRHYRK